jgi:hypothetical protein
MLVENMQSMKVNMKKLGHIGTIISFLIMFVGIVGFFAYADNNSITLIIMSFAALFSSFNMRTEIDQPILRFAVGVCIALALFSQAILMHNQYFATFGLVALVIFIIDYVKQSKLCECP